MNKSFYNSPERAFFIFTVLSLIFLVATLKIEVGDKKDSNYLVLTVEFEYFGMDPKKLEELITIPLEEKLNSLNSILELSSVVEYSKTLTSVYFSKKENPAKLYLAVRRIADSLYSTLPSDVQKPRVYSSVASDKGIFCVAFTADKSSNIKNSIFRNEIESKLKKRFESIAGVSEVVISGGEREEILISFNPAKLVLLQLFPEELSQTIQNENFNNYTSFVYSGNQKQSIEFNTKLNSIEQLKKLSLTNAQGTTQLQNLASINYSPKQQTEKAFLNGKECVFLTIKSASDGNCIKISKKSRAILNSFESDNIEYKILYDFGQKQHKLLKNVIFALVQSFLCVVFIIPFFFSSVHKIVLVILMLPFSCLWTAGLLCIFGISVNQNTVAGISIALGLVVDPALVVVELAENSIDRKTFFYRLKKDYGALVCASLTTILACVPLFFTDSIVPGIKNIALAVSIMIFVSSVLVLVFLPCFLFNNAKRQNKNIFKRITTLFEKKYVRASYRLSHFSIKHKKIITFFYVFLVILPFFTIFAIPKNLKLELSKNVIFCSVDFETEKSVDFITEKLSVFTKKLLEVDFIEFVKSEIRNGSAEFEIGFSQKVKRAQVASFVQSLDGYAGDGFLFVSGAEEKNQKKHTSIQVAFTGEDSLECRKLAKQAAFNLSQKKEVSNVVLNFKNEHEEYVFIPELIQLVKNGLTVKELAFYFRWILHGPVADKWSENGFEQDIRIVGENFAQKSENPGIEKIKQTVVPTSSSQVFLSSLGKIEKRKNIPKIYRKDGRRCAYITVEIEELANDRAVLFLQNEFQKIDFKNGYSYSLDWQLSQLARNYRILFCAFAFCFVQIFLLLLMLTENLKKSIQIILTVGASAFLPVFIKLVLREPLFPGDVCGIIVLCGIAVNNAIYILESKSKRIEFKVRSKLKSILVSSLTTVAGSLPLLVFSADQFSKNISFFMFFGILNSVILSLIFLPGIFYEKSSCFKRLKWRFLC